MIPPSFIQELLSRVDIVEVVGRDVQLRKAGSNHLGLCPFHGEKTPSFTVSASKQFYHCFGCGANGDAIRFLTEQQGMSFIEAVQNLAQQVGLVVPEDDRSPKDRERAAELKKRQATLSDVLEKASDHYRKQLKNSPRAVAYLKGRGLTGEIAARFALGYAPEGWRGLASVFPSYDDPLLEESGMVIVQGEDEADKKRYDRFRDRIMFPIRSVQGEVIGFGGRVLDKGEPKYLNSPETPVFVKGRELYGLHEARTAVRQRGFVLVVEGYMDVVALAQSGFGNAVATLGTACTAEHVHKLFRFTETVVFSFDGDAAGRRAAGRALEASLPHASDTRSVRFLFLPTEHDPDSYVREFGAEAFERCIEEAVPLSRQLVETAREGCKLDTVEGRARFLANARPLWFALPDGALKRQMLGELSRAGGLAASELTELWGNERSAPAQAPAYAGGPDDEPPPVDEYSSVGRLQQRPADGGGWGGGKTGRSGKGGKGSWRGKWRDDEQDDPSRRTARSAPAGPADHVLRMLLLHSEWWDQLDAADHDLLHALPPPHADLVSWLERQVLEHGPTPWAVLREALADTVWADTLSRWVPPSALEDDMRFADLRRVIDGLWVARLAEAQKELLSRVDKDPAARTRWRELDEELRQRKKAMDVTQAGRASPPQEAG